MDLKELTESSDSDEDDSEEDDEEDEEADESDEVWFISILFQELQRFSYQLCVNMLSSKDIATIHLIGDHVLNIGSAAKFCILLTPD